MLDFEAGDARVRIDPSAGGRVAFLRVNGLDLLVGPEADPVRWGCYPMAPWAGRVRNGRFAFGGRTHQLPLRLPPHAIHGTVLDRPWTHEGGGRLSIDLGSGWPFPGRAVQEVTLREGELELRLEVHADTEPFPALFGWHPWFRRRLERGEPADLEFEAGQMYQRDDAGIPTGERVTPGGGPFDDCFTEVRADPVLHWPGALRLTLTSSVDHWVVYDEPAHALCVEPQSGPPDAFNLTPVIVEPGRPLAGRFTLAWT